MRNCLTALALMLLTYACQYPVDTSTLPDGQRFLVIDAELTPDYGKVRVTYTLDKVTSQGAYQFPTPPANASAYVVDSQGNATFFSIDGNKNPNFHGVVGETYRLFVTVDGNNYESSPETMPACPTLDSLAVIYTEERNRVPEDFSYYGFDVYAKTQDIPGQANYYQWDWIHYERAIGCGVFRENGMDVLYPCNPYGCWNITYNTLVNVQSDQLRDGQPLAHKIMRVPFTNPPNKYYLQVQQRAITPTVFTYLQSLETQTQNNGSVFDIPAQTRFSPNIVNVNSPAEKILGVFSVFSYSKKVVIVDRSKPIDGRYARISKFYLPFTSLPLASAPCIEGLYRTQVEPEGWEE